MSEWISVKDRLPNKEGIYICVLDLTPMVGFKYRTIETVRYSGRWLYDSKEINYVTHWMPLPEPPKE